MIRTSSHPFFHGLLVLAVLFASVSGAWAAAMHHSVSRAPAAHCEHMAGEAMQQAQSQEHQCCQQHDQCSGCCQMGSSTFGFLLSGFVQPFPLASHLNHVAPAPPAGEHPALDIRPPIQHL